MTYMYCIDCEQTNEQTSVIDIHINIPDECVFLPSFSI